MEIFKITLPDDLSQKLTEAAAALQLPKSRIVENALKLYLEHLERAEYVSSYKQAEQDSNLLTIAEDGMSDFLKLQEK